LHQKLPAAEPAAVQAKGIAMTNPLHPHPPATKRAHASRRPLVPPLPIPAKVPGTPSRENSAERSSARLHQATESSKNRQLATVPKGTHSATPAGRAASSRSATPAGRAASSRSVTPDNTPRRTSTPFPPNSPHVTRTAWGEVDSTLATPKTSKTKTHAVDNLKTHHPATMNTTPVSRDPHKAWPSLTHPPADKVHPQSARKADGTAGPPALPRSSSVGGLVVTHPKFATPSLRPSSADSRTPRTKHALILKDSPVPARTPSMPRVIFKKGHPDTEIIPGNPTTATTPRNNPPNNPSHSGKQKNGVVRSLLQQASQAPAKKPFGVDFHNRNPVSAVPAQKTQAKDPHSGTKQTKAKKKR